MSRLVKAQALGLRARAAAANDNTTPGKEYLERVAKYVPAEIIATYIAVTGTLASVPEKVKFWALLGNLLICWGFTPIYIKLVSTPADKDSLRTQQIVSSIAFPIWAYSISGEKGIFGEGLHIYIGGIASALILLFSMISGAIVPKIKPVKVAAKAGNP